MDCKYCSGKISYLPLASRLKFIKQGENFILIELIHSSNELGFKPNMMFESEASGKVCRTKLEVNYCPMCGRKL